MPLNAVLSRHSNPARSKGGMASSDQHMSIIILSFLYSVFVNDHSKTKI
jgi:hypothetical protein